ncbi:unnamed protein product, partial [Polarella glacialis]
LHLGRSVVLGRPASAARNDEENACSNGGRRVTFREVPASFELTPRGSAQAAARYARQQCQQRLQVVTTMRRCERLSPGEAFRPE